MKVYEHIDACPTFDCAVATVGFFDGVHKGHQHILSRLRDSATRKEGEVVLITFWPHPRSVLQSGADSVQLLNTFTEKAKLLDEQHVQHLIKIPFTKQFSEMSYQSFVEDILVQKIGVKKLVIGYNHRFGKNKEGGIEQLKKYSLQYGFEVEQIPRQEVDNVRVGSSKIRKLLLEGYPKPAAHLLGRPYCISGNVIEGDKLGRKMGFPTANLSIPPTKLIPKNGVYAVTIQHQNNEYSGMLYIGYRPTINGDGKKVIEINIFDFDKEIYGDTVCVDIVDLVREDLRFDTLKELVTQIKRDKELSIALLHKREQA